MEFLTFHRQFVIPNHYFRYHGFNEFCNTGLIHLANTFEPTRYAVAAYAALLYSAFRRDQRAREYAFLYYAQSIYCVQGMMNEPSTMPALPTLVAILELGSFEVWYLNLAALMTSVSLATRARSFDISVEHLKFSSSFVILEHIYRH